ncbi:transposase, partial [Sporosarcina luteola]|nr:transposase [Sporosarcina luteola]
MTIIRQQSLFSIEELYEMEPTQKYEEIMDAIDLDILFYEINKKSHLGAPIELNYGAMIVSIFARYIERISTVKDLIKRLNNDLSFKLDCGFKVSENVPSEASYSRLLSKLSETDSLEKVQEMIVLDAITEGFIQDDTVAIDATHFEARDKASAKQKKGKEEPKKRGRKKKEEQEQWLAEQAAREENLPLYEKKIEDQLDVPLERLRA